jgi:hypothetical protein
MVCPPPIAQCDPSGDGTDCSSASLGCYLDGTRTVCDCRGNNLPGTSCGVFNSCIAGYRCISIATVNNGAPTCLKTCTLGGTDCPSTTCTSAGAAASASARLETGVRGKVGYLPSPWPAIRYRPCPASRS